MFFKKSIVIAAGYSVVDMKDIGYGLMRNPIHGQIVKSTLQISDRIIAISKSNKEEISYYTKKHIDLIYQGVDCNKLAPNGIKENMIITVGLVNMSNLKRKGLENFVKTARYLPELKFVLIGSHVDESIEYLRSIASSNVEFTGFISKEDLLEYYQKAKVYVQISAHEGFGISLAEAMLCECIPVVTDRGSIPELVGDTGFYVPYDDPKLTASAIKLALHSTNGGAARHRIKTMFPMENREREFLRIITNLLVGEND